MMHRGSIAAIVGVFCLETAVAQPKVGAASATQKSEKKPAESTGNPKADPGVNWAGQIVRATGSGAPDVRAATPAQARLGAERAALLDAFRNLLAQVRGIQVSAGKTMNDAMADDSIRAKVEGLVRGYKVAGKRYYSDGGVEVDIEVPLALLTDVVDPDGAPAQSAAQEKPPAESTATGLVIDAGGLKVTPALAPRVLDEAGSPLYTVDSLSAEARKKSGVAAYVDSVEAAKKSMKAGEKPLVVKAAKVAGTDVMLSSDDAKKLTQLSAASLAEGRVIIVMKN